MIRRVVQTLVAVTLLLPVRFVEAGDATLEILCYTDGATIYIDDLPVATTPMIEPVDVIAGSWMVRVERQGFLAWEEEVDFPDDGEVLLDVDLLPFAGIVRIVTREPGATVLIDGERLGVTPYEAEVPIGEHIFSVTREHYEDWSTTSLIAAGDDYFFEAVLEPVPDAGPIVIVTDTTPFYREWWFWSGAALLVGGGVVAGILLSEDEEAAPVDILIELP